MKFFIDTADINEIREAHAMGLVDGVTTNPSLVAKTGKSFETVLEEICAVVDGPISAEAASLDFDGMMAEARKLASFHENIVIKIPMTIEGTKAARQCSREGIKTNVTLIFTATQALIAAKAGATYVSPFIGRLDDISHVGMGIIQEIVTIFENYQIDTEVIVASVRNPLHVLDAATLGADIATIPFKVIKQLVGHPLTDAGIQRFLDDWEKVPKA